MSTKSFEPGDLVWAKMKGYPLWPGQIIQPPPNSEPKEGFQYVLYFGNQDFACMKEENILHHSQELISRAPKKRTALFSKALQQIILESQKDAMEEGNAEGVDSAAMEEGNAEGVDSTAMEGNKDAMEEENAEGVDSSAMEEGNKDAMEEGNAEGVDSTASNISPKAISPSVEKLEDKSSPRSESLFGEQSSESSNSSKASIFDKESSNKMVYLDPNAMPSFQPGFFKSALALKYPELLPGGSNSPLNTDEPVSEMYGEPTSKKIGFLGLGNMGKEIAKRFLDSGHTLTVWNRTPGKSLDLIKSGAVGSRCPAEVVASSDIIFCCVSDEEAAKSLIFQPDGVLKGLKDGVLMEGGERVSKGYVDLTSYSDEATVDIEDAIKIQGGRFLKVFLYGTKENAEKGKINILASGDKQLFEDCRTCFDAIANRAFYVGSDVGASAKYGLVLSSLTGVVDAAMGEALALVDRVRVDRKDFLTILGATGISSSVISRARAITPYKVVTNTALKNQQKDIGLTVDMGNRVDQCQPVTAAANEAYKHAKLIGLGDHDSSAIYYGVKR